MSITGFVTHRPKLSATLYRSQSCHQKFRKSRHHVFYFFLHFLQASVRVEKDIREVVRREYDQTKRERALVSV